MRWHRTSVGKKYIMALSGLAMVLYVIAHMLGNLSLFAGPDAINAYAVNLRKLGPLLWIFRLALLVAVLLHIWFAIRLNIENRKARPIPYARRKNIRSNLAAETMIWNGLLLGLFIIYHLLHFTFRLTNPSVSHFVDLQGRHDTFAMVVLSFKQAPVVVVYIAAMVVLCLHLYHGVQSLFQSIGLNSTNMQPTTEMGGRLFALIIATGFAVIPSAILLQIFNP